jgi:hypothetical protein
MFSKLSRKQYLFLLGILAVFIAAQAAMDLMRSHKSEEVHQKGNWIIAPNYATDQQVYFSRSGRVAVEIVPNGTGLVHFTAWIVNDENAEKITRGKPDNEVDRIVEKEGTGPLKLDAALSSGKYHLVIRNSGGQSLALRYSIDQAL